MRGGAAEANGPAGTAVHWHRRALAPAVDLHVTLVCGAGPEPGRLAHQHRLRRAAEAVCEAVCQKSGAPAAGLLAVGPGERHRAPQFGLLQPFQRQQLAEEVELHVRRSEAVEHAVALGELEWSPGRHGPEALVAGRHRVEVRCEHEGGRLRASRGSLPARSCRRGDAAAPGDQVVLTDPVSCLRKDRDMQASLPAQRYEVVDDGAV